VHRIDGFSAHHGLVPDAAIDGRRLAVGNFDSFDAAILRGEFGRRAEGDSGDDEAAPRNATVPAHS